MVDRLVKYPSVVFSGQTKSILKPPQKNQSCGIDSITFNNMSIQSSVQNNISFGSILSKIKKSISNHNLNKDTAKLIATENVTDFNELINKTIS